MKYSTVIPLLFLLAFPVHAIRVPGLYQAEVPVEDRDAESRAGATRQAMQRVLVKLTGDRNASGKTALAPVVEQAENYVQQYRYIEVPQPVDALAVTGSAYRLQIQFDEDNLNIALRELGVPIWGRERPSVLVWVVMEDDQTRRILNQEEAPAFYSVINARANDRGIVLIHPLFDLQDTMSLRVSDIWGGFEGPVLKASGRYQADAVLTGRLTNPLPGIWEGQWTLFMDEERHRWNTEGSFPETVLNEGIDLVADLFAARFVDTAVLGEPAETEITVVEIYTIGHYARVLDYLRSLSPVIGVQVSKVSKLDTVFRVTAYGGEQTLTQAINFGSTLEPVDQRNNIYRLLP